jgi:hypothetical protein
MNLVAPAAAICQFCVVGVAGYSMITQRDIFQQGKHLNYSVLSLNFTFHLRRIQNVSSGRVFLKKLLPPPSDPNFRTVFVTISICLLKRTGNAMTDTYCPTTGHFL